jgi:hypothetical protein
LGALIYQSTTGRPFGSKPASNGILVAILLFFFVPALIAMIYARLKTKIDNQAIYYGWNLPSTELNKLKLTDIRSCEIITYRFVGYGFRLSGKYGLVYNVSGNRGLQIITKTGDKILIGTRREKEIEQVLSSLGLGAHGDSLPL